MSAEPSLIEQAIIEHWGERCPEYEAGCHTCEAWKEYEAMTQQNQSPVVTDEMVERAIKAWPDGLHDPRNKIAMRAALEAALPSGVRVDEPEWPDVAEDDPRVMIAAKAIAEHGIGRKWDDFEPVNAYDFDHGDLIEYGRAAVAALSAIEPAPSPSHAETVAPYAAAPAPAELEVVATAWTYIGQRHVDFRFEPDARSIELGHLSEVTPLVRLTDAQAAIAAAEESENEAKDSFWAIYPEWIELKGHGISTEAARAMLVERAEAAEARVAEMGKERDRLRAALGEIQTLYQVTHCHAAAREALHPEREG
ncbi:hypothetical protein NO932_11830 [Pelagibacterium sp. 26DY04]|uniref:hypothetical protein n=1 Tax=Pelagibacterium sp. 26DY04 TaxID=2967130 RepID=UPI002814FF77|nr:hypothetical protein [Pelagibacterium sp. 26DY04]WMT85618.1 hypothetical protein NO932_11830 [Pelagibacterium sp. 26DY04]